MSSGEDSCIGRTLSALLFVLLCISDVNEENDVDSKDAAQREEDVTKSDLGLQNPKLQGQEDSQPEVPEGEENFQPEVPECEGAQLKESGMTSKESSHGSAGFHILERPRLKFGLLGAISGEKQGLVIGKASEFKDGGRRPVVSKSGSQCLVGQKVQAVAKEVEVCERIVDPVTEQVEATTVEISVDLLPVSKEVQSTAVPVEAPAMAMQAGAEVVVKPPSTSASKDKARREKDQTESDDLELETVSAPENLYSAEKRTLKDLSELPGVTDSPVPVSESTRRTRSRAAKELEAEVVTKVTVKKGKGPKVGGTSSQKRAKVATPK